MNRLLVFSGSAFLPNSASKVSHFSLFCRIKLVSRTGIGNIGKYIAFGLFSHTDAGDYPYFFHIGLKASRKTANYVFLKGRMRSVDVITTQNVTINYELAEVRDRIFSTIIDTIAMFILLLLLSLIFLNTNIMPGNAFALIFVLPILLFYHLFCEIFFDGQSFGKRMLGIRVVKLTGREPSPNDYLIRWAMRSVDSLFSLGTIGVMLISSTEKGQRLGDLVANTIVIKVNPSQAIKLADILKIRTTDTYTPTYQLATQFTETEMLVFKEAMDRYLKYKNDAHETALFEACYVAKDRLGLDKVPRDQVEFIRTLIKDYVALSR